MAPCQATAAAATAAATLHTLHMTCSASFLPLPPSLPFARALYLSTLRCAVVQVAAGHFKWHGQRLSFNVQNAGKPFHPPPLLLPTPDVSSLPSTYSPPFPTTTPPHPSSSTSTLHPPSNRHHRCRITTYNSLLEPSVTAPPTPRGLTLACA
ncbi:hypothetical protein BZA05DRAFT_44238 [Tricharina praecox]|uniref:uncharacterized protein n=1 Tax=Tricharina praecox TaxID=43433 RepID=UPI00221F8211|nr:uncharacterized protein BZA05DRAFT_44238 [Tricharina praecox]KAI5851809.1 hypothetical protein BZA05DRAFT_44238 [Tricharina praecox]